MRIRAVLDANVLLMSFGNPDSYLDNLLRQAIKQKAVRLYTSSEIIAEYEHILEYKFLIPRATVIKLVNVVKNITISIEPLSRLPKETLNDKDDIKILECALEAKAHIIVTADKELIKLKEFDGVKIAHPSMLKYWFSPNTPQK